MNLPSTEELQRLLDETPDETWRAEIDEGNDWWNVVPSRFGGSHTPIAEGMPQPVAELMAESRVLAAEVIRLRECIESLQEHYRDLEKKYEGMSMVDSFGRVFCRHAAHDLTRILEGDQA